MVERALRVARRIAARMDPNVTRMATRYFIHGGGFGAGLSFGGWVGGAEGFAVVAEGWTGSTAGSLPAVVVLR